METKRMAFNLWRDIPDYPEQRDTLAHLPKIAEHLKAGGETLEDVAAGKIGPNGSLVKLDGHTRTAGWVLKMAPAPAQVSVKIYIAKDADDLREIYKTFNHGDGTKTVRDQMFSTMRRHDLVLTSPRLKEGDFAHALQKVWSAPAMPPKGKARIAPAPKGTGSKGSVKSPRFHAEAMPEFRQALLLADQIGFPKKGYRACVLQAVFLSLHHWGTETNPDGLTLVDFWQRVVRDGGIKTTDARDGVLCATDIVKKATYGTNWLSYTDDFERLVTCCVGFMNGRPFKRKPARAPDLRKFRTPRKGAQAPKLALAI